MEYYELEKLKDGAHELSFKKIIELLMEIRKKNLEFKFENFVINFIFRISIEGKMIHYAFEYDARSIDYSSFIEALALKIIDTHFTRKEIMDTYSEYMEMLLFENNIIKDSKLGQYIYSKYINNHLVHIGDQVYNYLYKIGEKKINEVDKENEKRMIQDILNNKVKEAHDTIMISREPLVLKHIATVNGLSTNAIKYLLTTNLVDIELEQQMGYIYLTYDIEKRVILLKESLNSIIFKEIKKIFNQMNLLLKMEHPKLTLWKNYIKISLNYVYSAYIFEKYITITKNILGVEETIWNSEIGDPNGEYHVIKEIQPLENIYFYQFPYFVFMANMKIGDYDLIQIERVDVKEFNSWDLKLINKVISSVEKHFFYEFKQEEINKQLTQKRLKIKRKYSEMAFRTVKNELKKLYYPSDYSYMIGDLFDQKGDVLTFESVSYLNKKNNYYWRYIAKNKYKLLFELRIFYTLGDDIMKVQLIDVSRSKTIWDKKPISFNSIIGHIKNKSWGMFIEKEINRVLDEDYIYDSVFNTIKFGVEFVELKSKEQDADKISFKQGELLNDAILIKKLEMISGNYYNKNSLLVSNIEVCTSLTNKNIEFIEIEISDSIYTDKIILKPLSVELPFKMLIPRLNPPDNDADNRYEDFSDEQYFLTKQFIIMLDIDIPGIDLDIVLKPSYFDTLNTYKIYLENNAIVVVGEGLTYPLGNIKRVRQDQLLNQLRVYLDNGLLIKYEIGEFIKTLDKNSHEDVLKDRTLMIERTFNHELRNITKGVLLFKDGKNYFQIYLFEKREIGALNENIIPVGVENIAIIDQLKLIFDESGPINLEVDFKLNGKNIALTFIEYATYDIMTMDKISRVQLIGIFPDVDKLSNPDIIKYVSHIGLDYEAFVEVK